MKLIRYILVFMLSLFCVSNLYAGTGTDDGTNFPTSGVWPGGKLTKNITVYITNTIWIKSPVIVPSGKTLTISIDQNWQPSGTDKGVRIRPHKDFAPTDGGPNRLFEVESGGTLRILGLESGKEVLIKANALQTTASSNAEACEVMSIPVPYDDKTKTWVVDTDAYKNALNTYKSKAINWAGNSKTYKNGAVIIATGTLEMNWTRVYDAYSTGYGCAIVRTHVADGAGARKYGTITLNNCRITQNYCPEGTAIYVQNQRNATANTADGCKVTLNNCTIAQNVSTNTGASGVIRTGGDAVSSIEMNGCNMYENYSYGDGGVVYWNGHGADDTMLTINSCSIRNNRAEGNGGALVLESSFQFTGTTGIYNNHSLKNGGGCWIISYNSARNDVNSIDMPFNNAYIHDNSAVNGGGIYIHMKPQTSYPDGTDVNINLTGVRLEDNDASGNGGGFYYLHDNATLDISLEISSGNISGNTAGEFGGGIYCEKSGTAPQDNCKVYLNGGTISNNTSASCGGGIAVRGLDIYSDQNGTGVTVNSNTATEYYGGGIYVDHGSNFIMNSGTVSNNTSGQFGGGVFIGDGGTEVTINGGTITGNESQSVGGGGIGVYGKAWGEVNEPSKLWVNGGEISGNTAVSGGGIYQNELSEVTIKGGVIGGDSDAKKNQVTSYGGGVYVTGGVLNIDGGKVLRNTCSNAGGGIAADSAATITLSDGDVNYNQCTNSGAGIWLKASVATITGGFVNNNTATKWYGGGIYVDAGAELTMNSGVVSGNTALKYGAGVYVGPGSKAYFDGGKITGNISSGVAADMPYGGGICVYGQEGKLSEIEIKSGEISGNQAYRGGGMYLTSYTKATINGGVIGGEDDSKKNYAIESGGGVYMESSDLKIDGGKVLRNVSDQYGGGIYVNGGSMTMTDGIISGNSAANGGGGVYFNAPSATMALTGGEISNNMVSNGNGGGIWFGKGTLSVGNGIISGNTASWVSGDENGRGGGVYMGDDMANVTVTGGQISENNARKGAGINVTKGILAIEDGTISNNKADLLGGGIAVQDPTARVTIEDGSIVGNKCDTYGAGIYIHYSGQNQPSGDALTFTGGVIEGNEAGWGGGGLFVDNNDIGVINISMNGGSIFGNTAKGGEGGGIFLAGAKMDFTSGSISGNTALRGGGLFQQDGTVTTMTGGQIVENKGRCGGGVFLTGNNTSLTFGNGLIRGNVAEDKLDEKPSTGYHVMVDNVTILSALQGTGGGVYLQEGAALSFTGTNVGLYGNEAETMADDVYANGTNTSVTLPYVGDMDLSGYQSKTSELFWVEDYMTNDTGYANGTNVAPSGYKAVRYRDALEAQSTVYPVTVAAGGQTYANKYLALSLGHEIIFITIIRSGLLKGENAIYRISRQEANDTWTPYSEIIIFGPKDADATNAMSKSSSKTVALYSGTWKVEEIGWAWSYDHSSGAITHTIGSGSSAQEKSFIFMGSKLASGKEGYVSPEYYGESVVTNDFGSGTADTDKGAPASSNSFETITPEGGVSW